MTFWQYEAFKHRNWGKNRDFSCYARDLAMLRFRLLTGSDCAYWKFSKPA